MVRIIVAALIVACAPGVLGYRASLQRATAVRPLATPGTPLAVASRAPSPVALVVDEDYKLAGSFFAIGALVLVAPWVVGVPFVFFGLFLAFQTLRIRFVFDDDAFEVKTKPLEDLFSSELTATGDNFAVGGDNRWSYDSFVNYDFFPSVDLPVLVYFKETQTPQDKWDVGPGKWANGAEALAKGAAKGQVHFFPCIAKADVLKEQFAAKGCVKL